MALALLPFCAGCATIVEGPHQYVDLLTYPAGAECDVQQGGIPVTRVATPASVLVRRGYWDLEISCLRVGYDPLNLVIPAHFIGDTFGNLLFFPPGIAFDGASGAWFAYPDQLMVHLPRPDPLAPHRTAMAPTISAPPPATPAAPRPPAIIATPLPPPAPTPLVLPPHGVPPPAATGPSGPAVPVP
jgi:hypothetical protein